MAIYCWLDNRELVPARQRLSSLGFLRALQARLAEAYPASEGHTHSITGTKDPGDGTSIPLQRELTLTVRRGDGWGVRVHATSVGAFDRPFERLQLAGLEGTAFTGKATALVLALVMIAALVFAVYGVFATGEYSVGAGYQLFMIAAMIGVLGGTVVLVPVHALMNLRMRGDVAVLREHMEAALAASPDSAGAVLRTRISPFVRYGLTTIALTGVVTALYFWFLRAPEGVGWICGLSLAMVILGIYAVLSLGATIGAFAGILEGPGLFAEEPPAGGPTDPGNWF